MKTQIPSNKNFGITFGIIFIIVSIILFFYDLSYLLLAFIGLIFIFLGIINSKFLYPLNFIWFKFGIFLSRLISPLILFLMFYLIITPYGLIVRLFKKEIREIKSKKKTLKGNTFWNKSDIKYDINFDKQF
tara:strand:- start:623 stop:1015 length:393 start_codon:yes stop_codon:yes gene_type:complete